MKDSRSGREGGRLEAGVERTGSEGISSTWILGGGSSLLALHVGSFTASSEPKWGGVLKEERGLRQVFIQGVAGSRTGKGPVRGRFSFVG